MDIEKIEELVDDFIKKLAGEFDQLRTTIDTNQEAAREELKCLGLSEQDAPRLLFDLVDPMGAVEASKERCSVHNNNNMFDILDRLDPEEEAYARRMIGQGLREMHAELNRFFSSDD